MKPCIPILLLSYLALAACAGLPADPQLLESKGDANLNFQATGIDRVPFGRISRTWSYMEYPGHQDSSELDDDNFRVVSKGDFKGWNWRVEAVATEAAGYDLWRDRSAGRVSLDSIFQAIYLFSRRVIGAEPPPFTWTVREVPAMGKIDKKTYAYSFSGVDLTYYMAAPLPSVSRNQQLNDWRGFIIYQCGVLAHEAFQATVGYGGLIPDPPDMAVREAEATLFHAASVMLAAQRVGDKAAEFRVPVVKNLSPQTLRKTPYYLGLTMAALYLGDRLNGNTLVSVSNPASVDLLLKAATNGIANPSLLEGYRTAATELATQQLPAQARGGGPAISYGYPVVTGGLTLNYDQAKIPKFDFGAY
jgi:hypothetical protein